MHQEINNLDISKVYACIFRPVKSPMRTLYAHGEVKERKRSSRRTCLDRLHVCSFGNIYFNNWTI